MHLFESKLNYPYRVERLETWWEIGGASGLIAGPSVLCGDFNTLRYPSEKKIATESTKERQISQIS